MIILLGVVAIYFVIGYYVVRWIMTDDPDIATDKSYATIFGMFAILFLIFWPMFLAFELLSRFGQWLFGIGKKK